MPAAFAALLISGCRRNESDTMIKIILSGCCGKMGKVLSEMISASDNMQVVAGVDPNPVIKYGYPVFTSFESCNIKGDVIIDYSKAEVVKPLLQFALANKTPLVIATTGHSAEELQLIKEASKECAIFKSGNMSLGINLLINLIKTASNILGEAFDVEIIEKHHNQKLDAPSGTALMLADAINSVNDNALSYNYDRHLTRAPRSKKEIGIHTVRGGTIVGEHSVIFAGHDEVIELKHSAQSRQVFATGTLRAAMFIKDKAPGLYNMDDLIAQQKSSIA